MIKWQVTRILQREELLLHSDQTYKEVTTPITYGYGNTFEENIGKKLLALLDEKKEKSIFTYCRRKKIVIFSSKQEDCLKRDLKNFV